MHNYNAGPRLRIGKYQNTIQEHKLLFIVHNCPKTKNPSFAGAVGPGMQKRGGGWRIPLRQNLIFHSGPAHITHGMSPSVCLKSEKFLALCDPIEAAQLKNVQIFPLNALFILLRFFCRDNQNFRSVETGLTSLSLQFARSRRE